MKTTATLAALLAAGALAQPHNHARHAHQKHQRGIEKRDQTATEWETVWETQIITVDATVTVGSASDGIFVTTTSSSSSETSSTSSSTSSTSTSSESETSSTSTSTSTSTTSTTTSQVQSSTYVPPTTSAEPSTTMTTVSVPPTTTQAAPAAAIASSSSSGGFSAQYSGFITYYDVGLGACGENDSGRTPSGTIDDPMIVAISYNVYFAGVANPNNMELCGKIIKMESPDNPGVYAYGKIRDACQACTTAGDLDVNIAGMQAFYPGNKAVQVGKGQISWEIM